MRLVVGLGNPGKNYRKNRHNIGFLVLENYCRKNDLIFKKRLKLEYLKIKDTIFIKPKTYMNRSGDAVTSILTKHKIDEIMVIVDDINLPLGEIRFRHEGGSGGHNGLKSIMNSLGTDQFKRFRIGVGSPSGKILTDYVLSDFSGDESTILKEVFSFSNELLNEYLENDFDNVLNYFSKCKKSYSEKIVSSQDRKIN